MFEIGAANETRTRDIHVGNVMLYQLSYSRFIDFKLTLYIGQYVITTYYFMIWYPETDLNRHAL